MKKLAIIALLLIAILPLSAGGSRETSGTTVTLWHSNSGVVGNAFEEIIDSFNEGVGAEQGIYIDAIYQGSANDVLTRVRASAAADRSSLPDIAQLDATAALDMMNADYLVLPSDLGVEMANLMPQAVSAYSSRRGVLAVPFNASSLLLYYNKTLFDELSIDPPATLDEAATIASQLIAMDSNGNITRYAFAGVPTTYELCSFIGAQNGLSYIVDEENGHLGTPHAVLFEEEGTFKNFLEHWKAFYDTGAVNNITSGVSTEFASGRTAMMLASSSNLSTVMNNVGGRFEVGTAFVPMVDEEATGGVNIGGGALFSFTESDAVKTVLEYLVSESVQLDWARKTGYMPLNTDLQDNADYIAFLDAYPQFRVAMEQTAASNPRVTGVWIPSAYQIYYSFQTEIRNVTENGKDIDQAVSDMATVIKQALDEYAVQNIN